MAEAMRAFLMRAADYTLTPLPAMLRLATRAPGLADPPGPRRVYRRRWAEPDRMTEPRARVMDVLDDYGGAAFTLSGLAGRAGRCARPGEGGAEGDGGRPGGFR